MICNPSDSERFDKSREYTFFVWEPGAPEAISISVRWDDALHGGTWRARRPDADGGSAVGRSPIDAALYLCVCLNICVDEIATEAVILRETEATQTERDAAIKERDKALDDLSAAITRCSGALAAHETEVKAHQHTAAERDLAVQRCNELVTERDKALRDRSVAQGERGACVAVRDSALNERDAYLAEIDAARNAFTRDEDHRGLDLATAIAALCARVESSVAACDEANRQFKEFKKLRPNAAVLLSLQDEVDALTKQRERLLRERETAVHERNEALGKLDATTDDRDAWQAAARLATETRDSAVKSRDEMTRERDNAVKSAVEAQRREREADGARVIAQREVVDMERERDTALCELEEARAELHRARELTRKAEAELGSATREFARSMESMRAELSAMTRMRDEAGETLAIAVQERERADKERQRAIRAHDRLDLLILKILNAKSGDGPEINPERMNLLRELAVSAGYAVTSDGLTRIYTELDVLRSDREALKVHAAVADGSLANAKETIAAQTKTIEDQSDKIRRVTDLADAQLVNAVRILQTSLATVTSERDAALAMAKGMTDSHARVIAERDTLYRKLTGAVHEAIRERDEAIDQRNEAIKERDAMTDARNAQWNATKQAIAERDAARSERDAVAEEMARQRDAAKAELAVAVEELARQHLTEKELRAALEQRPVAAQVRYVEAHAIVCEEFAKMLEAIGRVSQAEIVRLSHSVHSVRHVLFGMIALEVPARFRGIVDNLYQRETHGAAREIMMLDTDCPTRDPWQYIEHLANRQGVKIAFPVGSSA